MNTLFYCGAGELVVEQVSYIRMYILNSIKLNISIFYTPWRKSFLFVNIFLKIAEMFLVI